MILLVHNYQQVLKVRDLELKAVIPFKARGSIQKVLMELAHCFDQRVIIWCSKENEDLLNRENLKKIFHHKLIMASFGSGDFFIPKEIGFIEESPFIEVERSVTYPTWQMKADVGGIHASVLMEYCKKIPLSGSYSYFLNSLAKLGQSKGLLCYWEPGLLTNVLTKKKVEVASTYSLFQFVKQHYKFRWVWALFFNFLLYENRFPILPLFFSLACKRRRNNNLNFSGINVCSSRRVIEKGSVDVIIPTIGRKNYLYDVLQDLALQIKKPDRVIIVEQNPEPGSKSELDFLKTEQWPFRIKHIFTNQTGVCNARNLALREVESEWIFFNDDDNRFGSELLQGVFENINQFGVNCYSTPYLEKGKMPVYEEVSQTTTFGSGNSFVKNKSRNNLKFSPELEFGYGEDKDFGMQLRREGVDVVYFPYPEIRHLNAPRGGFRSVKDVPWLKAEPILKPSPTLMWYKKRHLSKEQILGYKTILFFKALKDGRMSEILNFNKRWKASEEWAEKL